MNVKLKENIWRVDLAARSATLLTCGQAFTIPFDPAIIFMRMRPYCTGFHALPAIAVRAGVPEEAARQLLASLEPSGMIMGQDDNRSDTSPSHVRLAVLSIVETWSQELAQGYIGNELGRGDASSTVLTGWLLEMYHYIKNFPIAIDAAYRAAPPGLAEIYARYGAEETGHEVFVLRSLEKLGLSADEVRQSVPLISTRAIGLLMCELFEKEPVALLVVAALVEAQEFNADAIERFKAALAEHYDIARDALDAYFEHQDIDVGLGHAQLLSENLAWLDQLDEAALDRVLDGVHDIKHAFDLQSLEIKHYYGALNGKYMPRQPMCYSAVC